MSNQNPPQGPNQWPNDSQQWHNQPGQPPQHDPNHSGFAQGQQPHQPYPQHGQQPPHGQGQAYPPYPHQGQPHPFGNGQYPPEQQKKSVLPAVLWSLLGLLLVGGIIFGIWFMTSGDDDDSDSATEQTISSDSTSPEESDDVTTEPETTEEESADEDTSSDEDGPQVADPDEYPLEPISVPEGELAGGVTLGDPVSTDSYTVTPFLSGSDITGYRIVAANAPEDVPLVTIFYDYSCVHCVNLEVEHGEELTQLVMDGRLGLDLRPLAFLTPEYSQMAANAFAIVGRDAPLHLVAFHNNLMTAVAEAGSPESLDWASITASAESAGVPAEVIATFETEYDPTWSEGLTNHVPEGFVGTPTVLVDGQETEDWFTGFEQYAN